VNWQNLGVYYKIAYVVTQNDTLYAINATPPSAGNPCSILSSLSLIPSSPTGQSAAACGDTIDQCKTIDPLIGILSTPVININGDSGTLYAVTETESTNGQFHHFYHFLHAVDITTLVEITAFASPQPITPPSGDANLFAGQAHQPAQGGQLQMQPPILDARARLNPLKIALLHWYLADTSTVFPVGNQPYGLCFDGANIWTANFAGNNVTKVRASDGEVLGTFAVGSQPFGVTFDGADVWVSNEKDNSVTKLRASDGKNLGTFAAGTFPSWMAFDGQNLWIPNSPSSGLGTVTRMRTDGVILGAFQVGPNPIAAAFDGADVWVTNNGSNTVTKLRASDGTVLGTFTVGYNPIGVAFDGTNIWVANRGDGTVSKLRASDGAVLGTFPTPNGGYGIAFDGTYIWVLRTSDGAQVASKQLQSTGVAFDGAYVWAAETNHNRVHKF
jgi:hypothetical protein